MPEPTHHNRSRPAHGVRLDLDPCPVVFVTVCTKNRTPWLASHDVHARLRTIWSAAEAWRVGRYVVMPDHVHLFCSPGPIDLPLDNSIRYWKSTYARDPVVAGQAWQRDHWDTRMRGDAAYAERWEYVFENPVRTGLVERAEDWPFAGELFAI